MEVCCPDCLCEEFVVQISCVKGFANLLFSFHSCAISLCCGGFSLLGYYCYLIVWGFIVVSFGGLYHWKICPTVHIDRDQTLEV
jgi:hypothetical protein